MHASEPIVHNDGVSGLLWSLLSLLLLSLPHLLSLSLSLSLPIFLSYPSLSLLTFPPLLSLPIPFPPLLSLPPLLSSPALPFSPPLLLSPSLHIQGKSYDDIAHIRKAHINPLMQLHYRKPLLVSQVRQHAAANSLLLCSEEGGSLTHTSHTVFAVKISLSCIRVGEGQGWYICCCKSTRGNYLLAFIIRTVHATNSEVRYVHMLLPLPSPSLPSPPLTSHSCNNTTQGYKQWLWDHEGKRYLDLYAGIITISVGYCHP